MYYNVIKKDISDRKPNTEFINDVINQTVNIAIAKIK